MDIPIYKNLLPIINENVLVIFTEHKDTHIEAELIEYTNIKGMMTYDDATRKKKIYDWKKEVPINKQMVAKVEEIFDATYIKLSLAYFDHKKDKTELHKELLKPFNDNKILLNIIKKLCYNNNLDVNDFWKKIIYNIDKEINTSLLELITEDINIINDLIKINYDNSEIIINQLSKIINNKISKIVTKFSLNTKDSFLQIKNLLNLTCDNIKFNYLLKYESTPNYILESSSEDSTLEDHTKFTEFIENNCSEFNVIYSI
jgi:hypothetical protein